MNIKEFVTVLEKLPQDMKIVISGYEGGFCDINGVTKITLQLNYNKNTEYVGPHESTDNITEADCIAFKIEPVEVEPVYEV